jgi:hypothetical protein
MGDQAMNCIFPSFEEVKLLANVEQLYDLFSVLLKKRATAQKLVGRHAKSLLKPYTQMLVLVPVQAELVTAQALDQALENCAPFLPFLQTIQLLIVIHRLPLSCSDRKCFGFGTSTNVIDCRLVDEKSYLIRLGKVCRRSGSDSLWFRIADAGGATAKGAFLQPQAF